MYRIGIIGVLLCSLVLPQPVAAKYEGEVAGWIPWWTAAAGVESARENLRDLDAIYPFVFEVNNDGSLRNRTDFEKHGWGKLFREADRRRVDVIPTIFWNNGAEINAVLSDRKQRRAHIREIVAMVEENDFDGIDIDYEERWPATMGSFSIFLKELNRELGRHDLVCTIEARTPPEDLYREVPEKIEYSNDYSKINRYCDRIQLMAYDQQRAVVTLNDKRKGVPYSPVADKEWVETVIALALKDFDAEKVTLGIPTYGRAWDITVAPEWYRDYTRVASLNHPRIIELSRDIYKSPIGRDGGGEGVITYFPNDSIYTILNVLPVPVGTPVGYEAAAKALLFANLTKSEVKVRFVSWSDAEAVEDKLDLANKYDLQGITLFKIDGEEDSKIWDLF